MRKALAFLLLVLAGESLALACTCVAPDPPEKSRPYAREAVARAIAIVEAEALTEYRSGGAGERVRVHRVLWGEAPREFTVARREFASSASCDLLLTPGEPRRLILYPAESASFGDDEASGDFAIQSLCADFLVSDGGFLDVTLDEARRRPGGVERG